MTTEASEFLRPLHERMPVVLAPEDHELWLSADTTLKEAQALLRPAPEDFFALTPVSTRVNSADNDDPGLIERAEVQPSTAASPTDAATGQLRLF